jgi:hypothetical protein
MPGEWLLRFRALSPSPPDGGLCANRSNRAKTYTTTTRGNTSNNPAEQRPIGPIGPIGTHSREGSSEDGAAKAQVAETGWRDLYEERAAIREHDGYHTRVEAERLAWGELQVRWHLQHGEHVPRDLCAGCRKPIGDTKALDLIDGSRVHSRAGNGCLIRHGNRWRSAATFSLLALGLKPPETNLT